MLQATWGERPPQGGCDRVVFQPTAAPELLASVMGGYSVLLWSLGCEDVPEPLILEPQHSEVRTLPAGNAGRKQMGLDGEVGGAGGGTKQRIRWKWMGATARDPSRLCRAQLITSCSYDEAGTRLLCGDAIGAVSVHAVPMSAGVAPIYTFQAHDASVSLLRCRARKGPTFLRQHWDWVELALCHPAQSKATP